MKQQKLNEIRDYKKNPRAAWEEPDKNLRSDLEFSEEDYKQNPTKQSEAEACDINNIMKRYEQTGFIPDMEGRTPRFEDLANSHDFMSAMEIVASAKSAFFSLAAPARAEFDNDPAKFLAYVEDAQHDGRKAGRLVELGLAELRPSEPAVIKAETKQQKADKTKQEPGSGASKDE